MKWPEKAFDVRVEEAYNWRDDIMEITSKIMHETDEARLSNIVNHFEVDLSEIRAFFEMKQQRKPRTNADRIRAMMDEELASLFSDCRHEHWCPPDAGDCTEYCTDCWLAWLKQEIN